MEKLRKRETIKKVLHILEEGGSVSKKSEKIYGKYTKTIGYTKKT